METRIGVRDVKRSEDVKNSKPLNLLHALYSCKESRGGVLKVVSSSMRRRLLPERMCISMQWLLKQDGRESSVGSFCQLLYSLE